MLLPLLERLQVSKDEPRSIADQNPEIPIWLIEIITSLLQKSTEHRFQSAVRLVDVLDQHLSRIQHPNHSGSHSAINQRIPLSGNSKSSESPEPTFRTTTSTQDINSSKYWGPNFFGPMVQVPTWMRVASYTVLAAIAIFVLTYSASLIYSGSLKNALEVVMVGAFLLTGPLLMFLILCRRTARQLVVFFALFFGLSLFGVLVFALIKNTLKRVNETDSTNKNQIGDRESIQRVQATSKVGTTDSTQQSHEVQCGETNQNAGSESVSMQFGRTVTPVPLESALHYTTVKSIGRAWILLTLGGVVLSLALHPTLSLAANSTQLISQAFQYPASMLGIWIMSMLGTRIFNP
jgi:ABC-type multidrug transport system fused ATPase/permease subunit